MKFINVKFSKSIVIILICFLALSQMIKSNTESSNFERNKTKAQKKQLNNSMPQKNPFSNDFLNNMMIQQKASQLLPSLNNLNNLNQMNSLLNNISERNMNNINNDQSNYLKNKKYLEEVIQMNPIDPVSFSNTHEVVQTHLNINININPYKEKLYAEVQVFYQCLKPVNYIILDSSDIKIYKAIDHNGKNLDFFFHSPKNSPKDIGNGLVVYLNNDKTNCLPNTLNYFKLQYKIRKTAVGIQFHSRDLLKNKEIPMFSTKGEAINARSYVPCQDTPSAKVSLSCKFMYPEGMTALFSGEKVQKEEYDSYLKNIFSNKQFQVNYFNDYMNNQQNQYFETLFKKSNFNSFYPNKNTNKDTEDDDKDDEEDDKFYDKIYKHSEEIKYTDSFFIMEKPIPTYLITFTLGYFDFIDIPNSICRIYFEKVPIPTADTLKFIENIKITFDSCHEYYIYFNNIFPYSLFNKPSNFNNKIIFVILPTDFYSSGMENPNTIFLNENVITDDASHDNVIGHEIAHFWTGNYITCESWKYFWINEGFATYLQRRAIREIRKNEFYEVGSEKDLTTNMKKLLKYDLISTRKNNGSANMSNNQKYQYTNIFLPFKDTSFTNTKKRILTPPLINNINNVNKLNNFNAYNNLNKFSQNNRRGISTYEKINSIVERNNKQYLNLGDQIYSIGINHAKFSLIKALKESKRLKQPKSKRLLEPEISGDPFMYYSRISYDKGCLFLMVLEKEIGYDMMDIFLKDLFTKFAYKSLNGSDLKALLYQFIRNNNITVNLNIEKWFNSDDIDFKEVDRILNEGKEKRISNLASKNIDKLARAIYNISKFDHVKESFYTTKSKVTVLDKKEVFKALYKIIKKLNVSTITLILGKVGDFIKNKKKSKFIINNGLSINSANQIPNPLLGNTMSNSTNNNYNNFNSINPLLPPNPLQQNQQSNLESKQSQNLIYELIEYLKKRVKNFKLHSGLKNSAEILKLKTIENKEEKFKFALKYLLDLTWFNKKYHKEYLMVVAEYNPLVAFRLLVNKKNNLSNFLRKYFTHIVQQVYIKTVSSISNNQKIQININNNKLNNILARNNRKIRESK